jgi:hypothetical protein
MQNCNLSHGLLNQDLQKAKNLSIIREALLREAVRI